MYTVDSSLVGSAGDTVAKWGEALAAAGAGDPFLIAAAYQRLAAVAGLNADLAIAQACDECDWFRHIRWTRDHNPAGIGIVSDATAGVNFGSAERGIMAHIALLCCFALPETPAAVRAWGALGGYGGFQRNRPRLGDLDGSWAVPGDGYAANIAAIANRVIGGVPVGTTVTGEMVVAAALAHLGDTHEADGWNGDHPVSMWCEADVEDWCTEGGAPQPHYGTAAIAGDAAPLARGRAPVGAFVYFRGPGWSPQDHVGISLGNGRTISGLTAVTVSDGWQDLASYRGWRMPVGVVPSQSAPTVRYVDGNPLGAIPVLHPFSSRWFQLDGMGLALPMMGYPVAAETTASGRRIQRFERGWYGVQDAPAPWDLVALLPGETPAGR